MLSYLCCEPNITFLHILWQGLLICSLLAEKGAQKWAV